MNCKSPKNHYTYLCLFYILFLPMSFFSRSALAQKFKQYYSWKNMIIRYVIVFFILLIIAVQFIGKKPTTAIPSLQVAGLAVDYSALTFAGEQVPFWWKYAFNQEKFDRELFMLWFSQANVVMIHKREPWYLPTIVAELKKAGIPEDFKYLPVIESSLRNVSYSTAWAAGLWQFMPATARKYWLIVDEMVDERLNVLKATDAAIAYLKDLYTIFGNWTLVAAAYNRWENWLVRDMEWQDQTAYYDLYLNSETTRYLFRMLATKYILEHKTEIYDASLLGQQYAPFITQTISVGAIDDIALWAKSHKSSYNEVKFLNPWIVGNILPEWDWQIQLFSR